jgi:hypothetical protein
MRKGRSSSSPSPTISPPSTSSSSGEGFCVIVLRGLSSIFCLCSLGGYGLILTEGSRDRRRDAGRATGTARRGARITFCTLRRSKRRERFTANCSTS